MDYDYYKLMLEGVTPPELSNEEIKRSIENKYRENDIMPQKTSNFVAKV